MFGSLSLRKALVLGGIAAALASGAALPAVAHADVVGVGGVSCYDSGSLSHGATFRLTLVYSWKYDLFANNHILYRGAFYGEQFINGVWVREGNQAAFKSNSYFDSYPTPPHNWDEICRNAELPIGEPGPVGPNPFGRFIYGERIDR